MFLEIYSEEWLYRVEDGDPSENCCIDTSGTALLILNNQPTILTYEFYIRVSIYSSVDGVLFRMKNQNGHYV